MQDLIPCDGLLPCVHMTELEKLRREHNLLVLESAYVKNENLVYEKKVKDEGRFRKKFESEINRLEKALEESQKMNCFLSHDENSNSLLYNNDQLHFLNEQLKTYKEDFYEEQKERQKLNARNQQLENQLEEAKVTLEHQQRKLLMYAELVTNPIRTQLTLNAKITDCISISSSKSLSVPSTPSYYQINDVGTTKVILSNNSLMTRSYKSNEHIAEYSIKSIDCDKKRRTSVTLPPYSYGSFHWDSDTESSKTGSRYTPPPTGRDGIVRKKEFFS